MFAVHCPRHASQVLLTHRNIQRIEGTGRDITLHWVCWCGHHGELRPQDALTPDEAPSSPLSAA